MGNRLKPSASVLKAITLLIPNYRLGKFQPHLPEKLQLKLVADTILDLDGVKRFLEKKG